jgi:hypothetical protein
MELPSDWTKLVVMVSAAAILIHLSLRLFARHSRVLMEFPLFVALALCGAPLVVIPSRKLWAGEFASDFLAGASIV